MYQISISFSSGSRLLTPSLFLSVVRWVWGFAVKCVGGRKKKSFLCRKMITYHFSVLVLSLSRWICSRQCHWVSPEMFFYSVSRSQWGHAAGTTPWPAPLTVSIPIRFFSSSSAPLPIYPTSLTSLILEQIMKNILYTSVIFFSLPLTVKILPCQNQTKLLWNAGK